LPMFSDVGLLKIVFTKHNDVLEAIGRHITSESEKTTLLTKRSEQIIN